MKCCITIFIMLSLFIFCGCEKADVKSADNEIAVTTIESNGMTVMESDGFTNVFSSTKVPFQYDFIYARETHLHDIFVLDNRIYLTPERFIRGDDGEYNEQIYMVSYDSDGGDMTSFPLMPTVEGAFVAYVWYDSEYNLITIEELNYYYTLYKKTSDGEVIFSVPLDIREISMMVIGDNDNIYIGTDDEVIIYSSDGKLLCSIKLDNRLLHISSAHGKRPILKLIGEANNAAYKYVNIEKRELEDIEMPVSETIFYTETNIIYGDGYDYYLQNRYGIYGYDIETNLSVKVLDWLNSEIGVNLIRSFAILSPEKMVMVNGDSEKSYLYLLNHIPDDELPVKTIIRLGCINSAGDQYFNEVISYFNKNNQDYRIIPVNYYSEEYGADSYQRLNMDIAASKEPDMMYIDSLVPMLNYVNKNTFVDMNTYLDKEPALKADLLPFVYEKAQINNVLPQLITRFDIQSLITSEKNVALGEYLSIEKLTEVYSTLPTGVSLFYSTGMGSFIDNLITECVDYEKGTCDFNIPEFKSYLELIKKLPSVKEYKYFDHMEFFNITQDNDAYFYSLVINDFSDYIAYIKKSFFPDAGNIVGYPTVDGSKRGDWIRSTGFSIFNTSENKDIAWEFIKSCLSRDYYVNVFKGMAFLPIKSSIEYQVNSYIEGRPYTYISDRYAYGVFPRRDKTSLFDDVMGGIFYDSEDLINEYMMYMESLENYYYFDGNIWGIINEEGTTYMGSDKSIEDTIKAIQSRVSIYMSETWG
jgi:hypothetical protein